MFHSKKSNFNETEVAVHKFTWSSIASYGINSKNGYQTTTRNHPTKVFPPTTQPSTFSMSPAGSRVVYRTCCHVLVVVVPDCQRSHSRMLGSIVPTWIMQSSSVGCRRILLLSLPCRMGGTALRSSVSTSHTNDNDDDSRGQ